VRFLYFVLRYMWETVCWWMFKKTKLAFKRTTRH